MPEALGVSYKQASCHGNTVNASNDQLGWSVAENNQLAMMIAKPPPIDIFSPSNVEFVITSDSLKGGTNLVTGVNLQFY